MRLVRQDQDDGFGNLPKTSTSCTILNIENWSRDIEHKKKLKQKDLTIVVSMDVSSLYTNIPRKEGTNIVCEASEKFHNHNAPIPTHYLREMLGLILKENWFQFNEEYSLQIHGAVTDTKMAVSFATIFMA